MDTIKTAVVVALLLAVLYGVYVTLNKETVGPPLDVAGLTDDDEFLAPPDIDAGFDGNGFGSPSGSSLARNPRVVDHADDAVIRNPRSGGATSQEDEDQTVDANDSAYLKPPRKPPVDTYAASRGDGSGQESMSPTRDDPEYGEGVLERNGNDELDTSDESLQDQDVAGASYEPAESTEYVASTNSPKDSASGYYGGSRYQDASTPDSKGNAAIAPTRFSSVKRDAKAHMSAGRYRSALATLSAAYGDPVLTPEENETLLGMLDPLAAKVIYSREHLLEPSYVVRRSDTLMDIAEQYRVPWQLLQNINGIANPRVMTQGTELKVVRGPFRAEISLDGSELTLFLDQLYAGRFPITIGQDPQPQLGDFTIEAKEQGRTYYAEDGRDVAATSPENPYGGIWIDLGVDNICIHGSPQQESYPDAGCIGLSPRDARDIFGILAVGSRVTIIR